MDSYFQSATKYCCNQAGLQGKNEITEAWERSHRNFSCNDTAVLVQI